MPNTSDPQDMLRRGIVTWWTANASALSSLGSSPPIAADDGSPVSNLKSDFPQCVIRMGDCPLDYLTNKTRHYSTDLTFEVFDRSLEAVKNASATLDGLLLDQSEYPGNSFTLPAGYVSEFTVVRFNAVQIGPTAWRHDAECRIAIVMPR